MNDKGFTLIEILIALIISAVILAGIYSTYYSQQKSYITQEQVTAMQQNLRAAMYFMEREIRMAGFDPNRTADAGILIAKRAELHFTADRNKNGNVSTASGNPDENIRYALTNDANGDGVFDARPCHLGRETWGGGLQTLAEEIDALNFVYLDEDGNTLDDDGNGNVTTSIDRIRTIQITLVARSGTPIPKYRDATIYTNQESPAQVVLGQQNDDFMRKRLAVEVKCRNMGL